VRRCSERDIRAVEEAEAWGGAPAVIAVALLATNGSQGLETGKLHLFLKKKNWEGAARERPLWIGQKRLQSGWAHVPMIDPFKGQMQCAFSSSACVLTACHPPKGNKKNRLQYLNHI